MAERNEWNMTEREQKRNREILSAQRIHRIRKQTCAAGFQHFDIMSSDVPFAIFTSKGAEKKRSSEFSCSDDIIRVLDALIDANRIVFVCGMSTIKYIGCHILKLGLNGPKGQAYLCMQGFLTFDPREGCLKPLRRSLDFRQGKICLMPMSYQRSVTNYGW